MARRFHSRELDLDGDWRIGETAFETILRDLQAVRPQNIVEFGSGVSSVRLAHALPDTQILTIEHAAQFYDETSRLRSRFDAHGNLSIRLHPLRWRLFRRGVYFSYSAVKLDEIVDAVIIDGPPHWTLRGRETCLYDIAGCLRVGGRVYLDDFNRPVEQEVVRSWLAAYPSVFSFRSLEVGHGIAVLEKQKECDSPKSDLLHFLRTLRLAYGIGKNLLRARVTRLTRPGDR